MRILLFWLIAAILVVTAHRLIEPYSQPLAFAIALGSTLASAWGWSLATREAGVSHALGAGTVWLILSVVVEMLVSARWHRGWFTLLGTPERPLLRSVALFVWIFAPALFVRRDDTA
jgi:hypothetical protein